MTEEIYKLLDDRRLKEGVDSLLDAAAQLDDWQLRSRVETLSTNYKYMLKYIRMGIQDPNMQEVYNKMLGEAYLCADRCEYILHSRKYPELYRPFAERRRPLKDTLEDIAAADKYILREYNGVDLMDITGDEERAALMHYQRLMDEIFDSVCFSTEWTQEDYEAAYTFSQAFMSVDAPWIIMIGALTVNLIHYFDPLKFAAVLHFTTSEETPATVTYYGLTSFVLISLIHDRRILMYKTMLKPVLNELTSCIKINGKRNEDYNIDNLIVTIQNLFVTCMNTEKIVKKINEEVLPGMMQTMMTDPARIQRILNGEDDEGEETQEKDRAEWQKKAEKVNEKMQELVGMHSRGADTYFSSFRHLKGQKFFRSPAHWFYKYNDFYLEIADILAKNKPAKGSILYELLNSQSFCDSDKFSFVLAMESLPQSQLRILLNSNNKNLSVTGLPEVFIWEKNEYTPKVEVRNFLQCMYRFFKLWRPGSLKDPFSMKFKFYNCQTLKQWLNTPEAICRLAKTYHFWECWKEGEDTFCLLSRRYNDYELDFESSKMAGYCCERNGEPLMGVLYYGKALDIKKDDLWITKRILAIQLQLEQYNWVMDTFEKLIKLEPDNMETLYSMAITLIKKNEFSKALNALFKIDYIKGYSARVSRGIGWCYLMTADFDKAEENFRKIIDRGQENAGDLMNVGHTHYFRYNMEEAYKWYKASYDKLENKKKFFKAFKQDMMTFRTVAGYEVVDSTLNSLIMDALKGGEQI